MGNVNFRVLANIFFQIGKHENLHRPKFANNFKDLTLYFFCFSFFEKNT